MSTGVDVYALNVHLAGCANAEIIHNDVSLFQHEPKLPLVCVFKCLRHQQQLPSATAQASQAVAGGEGLQGV